MEVDGIDPARIPTHIAAVMDGNGRWATQRGLKRTEGHAAGEEALFDAADTLSLSLSLLPPMFLSLKWNRAHMRQAVEGGFLNATDLADYLVKKGIPFREAHAVVGRLVRTAAERGVGLTELPLSEMQAACPQIGEDVYAALSLDACLAARDVAGGTAPKRVVEAIRAARERVARALS